VPNRPNILLIFTDEQSASAMSCAGNVEISTPAMDSLAADSMRFERAYCAAPSCAPARNSLHTGRMPHQIEFTENRLAHPEETLGRILSGAGYDCHYAGNRAFALSEDPAECGYQPLSPKGDAITAQRSAEFLEERGRSQSDRPFFLVSSFINPHNIYQWARDQDTYLGTVDERPIHDCPILPPNHHMAPFTPQCIHAYLRGHSPAYPAHQPIDDPNWWRRYRNAYFRMIEMADAQIGIVLDALRNSGQYDDTVVLFISDHGDCAGAHQWLWKNVLYEEALNVPFIFKPPSGSEARLSRAFVSTGLDVLPTFCDYAQADPPSGLQGCSLRPLVEASEEAEESWRQQLVVVTDRHDYGVVGRAAFDDQMKYVIYEWGRYREQLFDLQADPGEMVNLASSSRFTADLVRMRSFLREWCAETGDYFKHVPKGTEPAPY
jgi:arylsulfatase A-like enzyme